MGVACRIGDAATVSTYLTSNGILREPNKSGRALGLLNAAP